HHRAAFGTDGNGWAAASKRTRLRPRGERKIRDKGRKNLYSGRAEKNRQRLPETYKTQENQNQGSNRGYHRTLKKRIQTSSELFLRRNRPTNQCIPFRNGLEHEENDGDSQRENLFLFFKPIHPCFQLE